MADIVADGSVTKSKATLRATPERDRVSTGYRPLDEALHGGYPQGYAILLSSPSCDERDLLLRRFLESETKTGLTIHVTRDFGRVADLAAAYRDTFYVVVCNESERVSGMRNVVQTPTCDDLCSVNIAISSILRRAEPHLTDRRPRKLVIDLISDVLMSRRAVTTRTWLWDMIVRTKARGFTLLGVLNPSIHPPEEAQAILELFDGYISMEERVADGGTKRLARVRKMYACGYDPNDVELDREDLMRPLNPKRQRKPIPSTSRPVHRQGLTDILKAKKNG